MVSIEIKGLDDHPDLQRIDWFDLKEKLQLRVMVQRTGSVVQDTAQSVQKKS